MDDIASSIDVARVYEQDKAGLTRGNNVLNVTRGVGSSGYDEQEDKKKLRANEKITEMRKKIAQLSEEQKALTRNKIEKCVAEIEAGRVLNKIWAHVDMDQFYAACEIRSDPSLKDVPFAVGGMSMISTASYAARKYGVRSAMPGYMGVKLCPELRFVKSDFRKYIQAADEVRQVLHSYDSTFISGGLDESYLDLTDVVKERLSTGTQTSGELELGNNAAHAIIVEVANEIREAVYTATALTCSVGVAPNTMLAKVASDMNKPNGIFVLQFTRQSILSFLSDLPVKKINGIGRVTSALLKGIGVETCGDIREKAVELFHAFSECSFAFFIRISLGIGNTEKEEPAKEGEIRRKGISCERTFKASSNQNFLEQQLLRISEHLCDDMRERNLRARHMTLKMKTARFVQFTRCKKLHMYIGGEENVSDSVEKMYKIVLELFREAFASNRTQYRLLGIRMAQWDSNESKQKTLFDVLADQKHCCDERQQQQEEEENVSEDKLCDEAFEIREDDENREDFICQSCGALVINTPACIQEHNDYHFALSLQNEEPHTRVRNVSSKKEKQSSLKNYFSKCITK